jgi:hypothetical protein
MATTSQLDFAGDYHLPYIHLINHMGEGVESATHGENIVHLMVEFNIYESIFDSSVTGSIVIVDTQNLISKLPIQGTERLSFKLTTKLENETEDTIIDCLESHGKEMHVYAVTDKSQLNDQTLTYTIHFASREFVRNLRTRVSESLSGRMDQMVNKIFTDENYLDSHKTLNFQQTRNADKIVIPNLNPFSAIRMICKRSLPEIQSSKGVGYLFYETTKGFHFRSWESLCVDKGGRERESIQSFRYVQGNMQSEQDMLDGRKGERTVSDRITQNYKNVREYKFTNNFHDVAANTAMGTYGHRVITHNIYNKSYKVDDYHYHNRWSETNHLEKHPSITNSPVDYDTLEGTPFQKGVSDYPEAKVTVQPTTQFAHGEDTGNYGEPVESDGILEGARMAQMNKIIRGTQLELTVNGQARIESGDIIEFDLQSVENKKDSGGHLDPQYSGRYIITAIRHRVANEKFLQILTCVKDSSKSGFGYAGKSFTEIAGLKAIGSSKDIDEYDSLPSHKTPKIKSGGNPFGYT